MNKKHNTRWIKLKNFYLNINAISRILLSNTNYVEYVAIYIGEGNPELIEKTFYNKWVKDNNLDLPIFEENS